MFLKVMFETAQLEFPAARGGAVFPVPGGVRGKPGVDEAKNGRASLRVSGINEVSRTKETLADVGNCIIS